MKDVEPWELKFVTKPDAINMGRIIYKKRYYELPIEVVDLLERACDGYPPDPPRDYD